MSAPTMVAAPGVAPEQFVQESGVLAGQGGVMSAAAPAYIDRDAY